MADAILTDALNTDDEVTDAFFKKLVPTDADDTPSDEPDEDIEDSTDDDVEEDDSDEGLEDSDDADESDDDQDDDEPKRKRKYVDDDEDSYVKVKVGDEEHEIPVKDLKRLAGQEASLTRKSQELAATRKQVEDVGARHVAGLGRLIEQAKSEFEPYSKIDFLALAKDPDISADELTALRNEAEQRWNKLQFLTSELDATVQQAEVQRVAMLREQAKHCVQVLSDPETGIKGWNDTMYDELRGFAINQGIDKSVINELVDPAAIKLLHAAMMYMKGQNALKTKTTKVDKTPKKIVKTTSSEVSRKVLKGPTKAMDRLAKTGSQDDATAAFLERLG